MNKIEKLYIFILSFISGMAVLSIEILGGRVLQPDFGSDVYVWGSLITTFMLGLAVGYFIGGSLSEKKTSIYIFFLFFLLSGIYFYILPYLYPVINEFIFEKFMNSYIAPLYAALALFFVPSVILGMLSPYAVRLLTRNIETSGKIAGYLYAISTVGSTLGALLTTFWFIPNWGTKKIITIWGILFFVLFFISILSYYLIKRFKKNAG